MKWFKQSLCITKSRLRQSVTNYRMWCIMVLTVMVVHMLTVEVRSFVTMTGEDITPWIFSFLFTQRYVRLLLLFPIILLFCDAPFIDELQLLIILRTGRTTWCIGQILYIVIISFGYFLFVLILSFVINVGYIDYSLEWGRVIQTFSYTTAAVDTGVKLSFPTGIVDYFSPIQAVWCSYVLLSVTGILIGVLINCINLVFGRKSIGIIIASGLLVFDAVIGEAFPSLLWFSPISWNDISKIAIDSQSYKPDITYISVALAVIILGLVVICVKRIKKTNILTITSV